MIGKECHEAYDAVFGKRHHPVWMIGTADSDRSVFRVHAHREFSKQIHFDAQITRYERDRADQVELVDVQHQTASLVCLGSQFQTSSSSIRRAECPAMRARVYTNLR